MLGEWRKRVEQSLAVRSVTAAAAALRVTSRFFFFFALKKVASRCLGFAWFTLQVKVALAKRVVTLHTRTERQVFFCEEHDAHETMALDL